jgi:hypothetical protein
MASTDELPPDVFIVSSMMNGGQRSQPYEDVEHHITYRERFGEPGVTPVCPCDPGFRPGLENGHDLEAMARLESMHTGMRVTIIREPWPEEEKDETAGTS